MKRGLTVTVLALLVRGAEREIDDSWDAVGYAMHDESVRAV
jgi:hypothetical protein